MFKKIISYLIVFSIFYSDIAYCGNITGRMTPDKDEDRRTPVQATSYSYSESTEAESLASRAPSPLTQNEEDFFQAPHRFNFDAHNDGSDQKLDSSEPQLLSQWKRTDKPESETQSATSAMQDWNGLEPHDEDSSDEDEGGQKLSPTAWQQVPAKRHSSQEYHLFQTGGELPNLSVNEDLLEGRSIHSAYVLTHVKKWLHETNPDDTSILIALASLEDPHIGSSTKKFLYYLQEKIIEGKLNKKQMASILLGLGTGAGVVAITGVELFGVLAANGSLYFVLIFFLALENIDVDALIGSIFGISIAALSIDAVSRVTSFFSHVLKDSTKPFSIQKTKAHQGALFFSKLTLYGLSSITSAVPAYYLSTLINPSDSCEKDPKKCLTLPSDLLFEILFAATVLDKMTHYGYHLSHHAEHWINQYCVHREKNNLDLWPVERTRERYLEKLKDLKTIIHNSEADVLKKLYEEIFGKNVSLIVGYTDQDVQELKIREALRVLQVFNKFHHDHIEVVVPESSETWKKNISSGISWLWTLLATPGRHLALWYAFDEVLEDMEHNNLISYLPRLLLSIILGGVIAGGIQGAVDMDAIKETISGMLKRKKPSLGTSHYPLRVGIKIWNCFSATVSSIPYLFAGINALELIEPDQKPRHPLVWPLWAQLVCFFPFGIAGIVNITSAFNHSILNIVNGFDSLVSYCYLLPGYERDKLMRITVQLRELFKELRPDVLEAVDQLLKEQGGPDQQESSDTNALLAQKDVL